MATKRKAAQKSSAAAENVSVQIHLGPVKATPEQRTRLRELVKNHVLTWAKVDAGAKPGPVSCFDIPPGPVDSGNDKGPGSGR